ncbi:hypothetical protein ASE25_11830 [Terrabacter sp. Root85]|nr:hypothetical protein ASE25_11830 [Terrabacter sp. Root85]
MRPGTDAASGVASSAVPSGARRRGLLADRDATAPVPVVVSLRLVLMVPPSGPLVGPCANGDASVPGSLPSAPPLWTTGRADEGVWTADGIEALAGKTSVTGHASGTAPDGIRPRHRHPAATSWTRVSDDRDGPARRRRPR